MWPAQAFAHATLLRTDPAAGTRVATQPRQLTLTFDQQIRPVAGGTSVVDDQGRSAAAGAARNADQNVRQLVIPLKPGLPDGDYTVHWEIVSTDGHIIAGVYAIGLGSGGPPPQAAEQSAPLDWPYLTARFVYFAGLLLLVGGVVYRVAVYRPAAAKVSGEPGRLMGLRERHRANQVLAASAVLVLAGGWVALTRQGAEVAGVSFWEAFDHRGPVASALDATRFGRQFGRGIDVTAVFTILVALAYAAAAYSRRLTLALALPAAAAGVWALAAPGISGHAGDPGRGCAGDRDRRRARGGGGDLDRRPAAAGGGDAARHPRPVRGRARGRTRRHRPSLLADRRVGGGGAGGQRRASGGVGAELGVAAVDDLLRPGAAGEVGPAAADAGAGLAQPRQCSSASGCCGARSPPSWRC